MFWKRQEIFKIISDSDIIIIHWWNHPLLYDLLVRDRLPKCRLIIWSHNSGLFPPGAFTKKILEYPDLFVFTTPLSFEVEEIKKLSDNQRNNLRVIWSTGGIEHVKNIKPQFHKGFNIGYIGTVDYCKLHPDFLQLCKASARIRLSQVIDEKDIEIALELLSKSYFKTPEYKNFKDLPPQSSRSFQGVISNRTGTL